jgi:hypothetical protein
MDVTRVHVRTGFDRRVRRLVAIGVLLSALLMCTWMAVGPVSNAQAAIGQFCWGAGVGPWGHCTAGWGQWLGSVHGKGGQHTGCVNAYWNGGLVTNWACSPRNTWAFIGFDGSRWMQGTVKDNSGNSNVLYGEMWY